MHPRKAVVGTLVLATCGSPDVRPTTCDFESSGVCVVVREGVRIDAPHVARQLEMASAYWRAHADRFAGWAIVYFPEELTCNGARASGCTYSQSDVRTIQVQALDTDCAETAQVVHELGHAVHHDPGHDGDWWDGPAEQRATCHVVRDPGASPGCAASRHYARCDQ